MRLHFKLLTISILAIGCMDKTSKKPKTTTETPTQKYQRIFSEDESSFADQFDFPVGKPDAKGYYNAQPFGKNHHLGDDWNAVTGGDSDLGDPIYAIANGYVTFAKDLRGGWGNVLRIVHRLPDSTFVESLYAHCDTILAQPKTFVKNGEQIATIGTAHGRYKAHLHLEIREFVDMPLGQGYAYDKLGYLDPAIFIEEH